MIDLSKFDGNKLGLLTWWVQSAATENLNEDGDWVIVCPDGDLAQANFSTRWLWANNPKLKVELLDREHTCVFRIEHDDSLTLLGVVNKETGERMPVDFERKLAEMARWKYHETT